MRPHYFERFQKEQNKLLVFEGRTKHKVQWDQKELTFLEEHWYQKGPYYCAAYLHRSYQDVRKVALEVLHLKDVELLLDKEYRRVLEQQEVLKDQKHL